MTEPVDFEGFIAHQDGGAVVVIRGDVDLASVVPFSALIEQALVASPHVVFDVGGVTFLDSSGLKVVVSALHRVSGTGSITIRNAPPVVSRVLRLSGVDGILTVEP